ncbi:MAG: hypothetical protein AAGH53_08610 [Pseudomonadota bacterium]
MSGCGVEFGNGDESIAGEGSSDNLDEAAIAAGIIVDPSALDIQGFYERDSGFGTDRFCAIRQDDDRYQVGILAVFGETSQCEGRGTATLDGANVTMTLRNSRDDTCKVTASFDGNVIQIAGEVADSCAALCTPRASLAGVAIPLIDDSQDAAGKAVGRNIGRLCNGVSG